MAAEVSLQMKSDQSDNTTNGLITRDFLGGGCINNSNDSGEDVKELNLDLHVPTGWEKRLDLKSGKVYIQRCNPAKAVSDHKKYPKTNYPKLEDLNAFPQMSSSTTLKPTLNLFEQPSLNMKLISNCSPTNYTSVCTLDNVKSALDRAERSSSSPSLTASSRKRWMAAPSTVGSPVKTSSSLSNSSLMSVKETDDEDERVSSSKGSDDCGQLVAAACPGCLLYVLIQKNDPKCPRCSSVVQLPDIAVKKPKIDLNISI